MIHKSVDNKDTPHAVIIYDTSRYHNKMTYILASGFATWVMVKTGQKTNP